MRVDPPSPAALSRNLVAVGTLLALAAVLLALLLPLGAFLHLRIGQVLRLVIAYVIIFGMLAEPYVADLERR